MAKAPKTTQVVAQESAKPLTWREQRFVEQYIRNKGNASLAAREAGYSHHTCRQIGSETLAKPYIQAAIALEQEKDRQMLKFGKEDALKILLGMVLAQPSDFDNVLKDPQNKENYADLGYKEYAIQSIKKSLKNGNEVKFVDRLAALDDLWDKLGLDKDTSGGNFFDELGRIIDVVRKTKEPKQ